MLVILTMVALTVFSVAGWRRQNKAWTWLPVVACGALLVSVLLLELRLARPVRQLPEFFGNTHDFETDAMSPSLPLVFVAVLASTFLFALSLVPSLRPSTTAQPKAGAAAAAAAPPASSAHQPEPCRVAGVAACLPSSPSPSSPSSSSPLSCLFQGQNLISPLPSATARAMLDKNIVKLRRDPATGARTRVPIASPAHSVQLAALAGDVDLVRYGVSPAVVGTMDRSCQLAVAAGMEALRNSGIVEGGDTLEKWALPSHMQDTTGVVFATSFPAMEAAISEVERLARAQREKREKNAAQGLAELVRERCGGEGGLGEREREALRVLEEALARSGNVQAKEEEKKEPKDATPSPASLPTSASSLSLFSEEGGANDGEFEFDRKFLFQVLVLANAQLAQLVGAKGPNTQCNAACAGTSQAVALAHDWLRLGRAQRVVVIAGDNASGDTLMPWVGSGFLALGAASVAAHVTKAARPFGNGRNGLVVGAGGVGLVLETEQAYQERMARTAQGGGCPGGLALAPRVLHSYVANSAFHGAALHTDHIASCLERFLQEVEQAYGLSRATIAAEGVYLSHETMTYASAAASCASNEVAALRQCFGTHLGNLLILNTKGFTGHAMGVCFEDVVGVEVLRTQHVPPIANLECGRDEALCEGLKLSEGGPYKANFALRFAAGFGSQVVFVLYAL